MTLADHHYSRRLRAVRIGWRLMQPTVSAAGVGSPAELNRLWAPDPDQLGMSFRHLLPARNLGLPGFSPGHSQTGLREIRGPPGGRRARGQLSLMLAVEISPCARRGSWRRKFVGMTVGGGLFRGGGNSKRCATTAPSFHQDVHPAFFLAC